MFYIDVLKNLKLRAIKFKFSSSFLRFTAKTKQVLKNLKIEDGKNE